MEHDSFSPNGSLIFPDSFNLLGPLDSDDSFIYFGSLIFLDSFNLHGSLADTDSFSGNGSLTSIDSFGRNGSLKLDDSLPGQGSLSVHGYRRWNNMCVTQVCNRIRQRRLRAVVCLVPRTMKMR